MPSPTEYAEAPLNRLAGVLGKSLRRAVRIVWTTAQDGVSRAWVEVQDKRHAGVYVRLASLVVELRGPAASYIVASAEERAPLKKFAALAAALRELRNVVADAAETGEPAEVERASTATLVAVPAPPLNESPQAAAKPQQYRTRYTADEATGHPVIRAAVIVSHEVRRVKGSTPDPAELLALANKALDVVDLLVPPGLPEIATDAWVEKALVGMLTGALLAI